MIKENYSVISGSVTGTAHIKKGSNNQDAFGIVSNDDILIALVSDGCSVSNAESALYHSEVGSNLIINIALKEIRTYYGLYGVDAFERPDVWQTISQRIVHTLLSTAQLVSLYPYNWLDKNCLATLIGCIITPTKTYFIGCGDGIYGYNETIQVLKPNNKENYPAYLVFNIIPSDIYPIGDEDILLKCHEQIDTETIKSLFIGTDGVHDLQEAEKQHLPGQNNEVGELSQFWQNKAYWVNPYHLQNRLNVINTPKTLRDGENAWKTFPGLLKDDTTLIIIKKSSS
jgi:Protein phosphatase 2C